MTLAFALLATAALVIAAWCASAVLGGLGVLARPVVARLDPAARVRVWVAIGLGPLALSAAALTVALGP